MIRRRETESPSDAPALHPAAGAGAPPPPIAGGGERGGDPERLGLPLRATPPPATAPPLVPDAMAALAPAPAALAAAGAAAGGGGALPLRPPGRPNRRPSTLRPSALGASGSTFRFMSAKFGLAAETSGSKRAVVRRTYPGSAMTGDD